VRTMLAYTCHDLGRLEFYSRFTPLGLTSINGLLRLKGHDAVLLNASAWSWDRTRRFLDTERPDLFGVSVFTFNRHEAMRLAGLARRANPSGMIIAGGPHATHLPHHLLEHYPQVDIVVRGEGEETMLELVEARARGALPGSLAGIRGITYRGADGRVVDTPDREVIRDLDRLPFPAEDPATLGVDVASQFEFMITSRGCPAACTFCSSPEFWGRTLRFRSAGSMLEEIRLLRERYGVVYVSVRDDTFTVSAQRVIDFCRGLIDSGIDLLWDCQSRVNAVDEERLAWMRRAGCTHIQYGVESGSPRMLRRLNKGITLDQIRAAAAATRRVGLGLSIYLITGIDTEGDEDLESTTRLIEEIRPHDGLVSPLTVYPGTAQYEEAKARSSLTDEFWVRDRQDAFYVRDDPWTRRSLRTLRGTLRRVGRAAAYGPGDFARHRKIVKDCHALRLSIAEYFERIGRPGRAADEYRALLGDSPGSLWARMRLGRLAARRGKPAEAAEHYRAAIDLVPAFHLAHALLGVALARLGRHDRASDAFARALALCPGDPVALEGSRRLARASRRRRYGRSASTRLVSLPMPAMATVTSSPSASGPTPSGVPVVIRSPGRSVITSEA
jgi:anaerobic magnesium-protoporphyrin IX monomethyl ester cyclase